MKSGFKKIPKNYEPILTEDGSYTLYSKEFDENLHSTSGADGETKKYFIEDSLLTECNSSPIVIFETGFGIGKNFLEILKNFSKKNIHFISTEIDSNLVTWFMEEYFNKKINLESNIFEDNFSNIKLTILIGDATDLVPQYLSQEKIKINRIFQDPFSPKKNSTLWTAQWFDLLKTHSASDVILTTYSASHSIRENMKNAGWEIENLEGFGKKRSATRARLKNE